MHFHKNSLYNEGSLLGGPLFFYTYPMYYIVKLYLICIKR